MSVLEKKICATIRLYDLFEEIEDEDDEEEIADIGANDEGEIDVTLNDDSKYEYTLRKKQKTASPKTEALSEEKQKTDQPEDKPQPEVRCIASMVSSPFNNSNTPESITPEENSKASACSSSSLMSEFTPLQGKGPIVIKTSEDKNVQTDIPKRTLGVESQSDHYMGSILAARRKANRSPLLGSETSISLDDLQYEEGPRKIKQTIKTQTVTEIPDTSDGSYPKPAHRSNAAEDVSMTGILRQRVNNLLWNEFSKTTTNYSETFGEKIINYKSVIRHPPTSSKSIQTEVGQPEKKTASRNKNSMNHQSTRIPVLVKKTINKNTETAIVQNSNKKIAYENRTVEPRSSVMKTKNRQSNECLIMENKEVFGQITEKQSLTKKQVRISDSQVENTFNFVKPERPEEKKVLATARNEERSKRMIKKHETENLAMLPATSKMKATEKTSTIRSLKKIQEGNEKIERRVIKSALKNLDSTKKRSTNFFIDEPGSGKERRLVRSAMIKALEPPKTRSIMKAITPGFPISGYPITVDRTKTQSILINDTVSGTEIFINDGPSFGELSKNRPLAAITIPEDDVFEKQAGEFRKQETNEKDLLMQIPVQVVSVATEGIEYQEQKIMDTVAKFITMRKDNREVVFIDTSSEAGGKKWIVEEKTSGEILLQIPFKQELSVLSETEDAGPRKSKIFILDSLGPALLEVEGPPQQEDDDKKNVKRC